MNHKREVKPTVHPKEYYENYEFTKAQKAAYNSLDKAIKRCKNNGLSLLAKQFQLIAYPSVFYMNDMTVIIGEYGYDKTQIEAPNLNYARISDSGADDVEYIKDIYIK